MKVFWGISLLLVNLICDPALAKQMAIAPPDVTIATISSSGAIAVTVRNPSASTIKLCDDGNSWGASNWRVLVLRKGRLQTFYQNPNQHFTRNIPQFREIPEGKQIQQRLDLNKGNWCRPDYCASFDERGIGGKVISLESNDIVFVVYDVPRTEEAVKMGVWYGVVSAVKEFQ